MIRRRVRIRIIRGQTFSFNSKNNINNKNNNNNRNIKNNSKNNVNNKIIITLGKKKKILKIYTNVHIVVS